MKKYYEAPDFCVERFELNETIALGCSTVVSLGPGDATHVVCSEYGEIPEFRAFSERMERSNFYEGGCDCYLSSGDTALFTS